MTDHPTTPLRETVERVIITAGDLAAAGPDGAVIRGDKTLPFAEDLSALCEAVTALQAENARLRNALGGIEPDK